jgi:hypothetical protein
MKVVNINGRQILAKDLATADGVTVLEGTMEFGGGTVTAGVVSSFLQKENVGELGVISLNGMQSYEVRDLTKPEAIELAHQTAKFELAKEIAIPRLENQTFASL